MKKIKILLTSLFALLLFSNCSKQPDCTDEESVQLAKDLLIQEMNESTGKAMSIFGVNIESKIKEFVDNYVEISSIRVTSKEKELKRCDCATQISFNFTDEMMDKIEKLSKTKNTIALQTVRDLFSSKIQYEYTLQFSENTEDELFIEGIVPTKELQEIFMGYTIFKKRIDELESNEEIIEKENSVDSNKKEQELMLIDKKDIELAKTWLINAVVNIHKTDSPNIYTEKFSLALAEAPDDYDDEDDVELSESEFSEKWGNEYDFKKINWLDVFGDFDNFETTCVLKTKQDKYVIFNINIKANTLNSPNQIYEYNKEVKIVKINEDFYIDNIIEDF